MMLAHRLGDRARGAPLRLPDAEEEQRCPHCGRDPQRLAEQRHGKSGRRQGLEIEVDAGACGAEAADAELPEPLGERAEDTEEDERRDDGRREVEEVREVRARGGRPERDEAEREEHDERDGQRRAAPREVAGHDCVERPGEGGAENQPVAAALEPREVLEVALRDEEEHAECRERDAGNLARREPLAEEEPGEQRDAERRERDIQPVFVAVDPSSESANGWTRKWTRRIAEPAASAGRSCRSNPSGIRFARRTRARTGSPIPKRRPTSSRGVTSASAIFIATKVEPQMTTLARRRSRVPRDCSSVTASSQLARVCAAGRGQSGQCGFEARDDRKH